MHPGLCSLLFLLLILYVSQPISLFVFLDIEINMSDIFNFRSFFENQMEKLSTPSTTIIDKFRQTVDVMKTSFTSMSSTEQDTSTSTPPATTANEVSFNLLSTESQSSSSLSSNSSNNNNNNNNQVNETCSNSTNTQRSVASLKYITHRLSHRQSFLKRHVSESNKPDEKMYSSPIYHDNPPTDVDSLLKNGINHQNRHDDNEKTNYIDRSRSLIRQSTDTTTTFPIRRSIRRMESVEIPGLNGVKAIRYIHDNLGKLEPNLYKKPIQSNDPSYDSGQIIFTLFYNLPLTTFVINMISLNNLPYRDSNSKSLPNPFIKLTLLPDRRKKFQTKVYKRTRSVQVNENFEFQINYDQLCKRVLLVSVYDFRRSSKRNLIGTVKIDDICTKIDITANTQTFTKDIVPGTEVSTRVFFLFLLFKLATFPRLNKQ